MLNPIMTIKLRTESLLLCLFALLPASAKDAPPHILYIVADDIGWKNVGFHGAEDIKTPNLDKLAAEGSRLDCPSPPSTDLWHCRECGTDLYPRQTAVIPPERTRSPRLIHSGNRRFVTQR